MGASLVSLTGAEVTSGSSDEVAGAVDVSAGAVVEVIGAVVGLTGGTGPGSTPGPVPPVGPGGGSTGAEVVGPGVVLPTGPLGWAGRVEEGSVVGSGLAPSVFSEEQPTARANIIQVWARVMLQLLNRRTHANKRA